MRQYNGPQTTGLLTSCLCTQAQHELPEFRWWAEQMHEPHRLHRKLWEFCYIAHALHQRGMLAPGRRGLGFAVGKEPLPALFASFGCEIVASDLDFTSARDKGWTNSNQHASQLEDLNERGICPADEFRKLASFRVVDMNDIPADLTGFDFVWSSCAFEHLGSIKHGIRFIERMTRCLRPGGVAIHTTEFNLSSNFSTWSRGNCVIYRHKDVLKMIKLLELAGHEVEPLTLDRGQGPADQIVDQPPYQSAPHLKLQLGQFVTTSLGLIIRIGTTPRPSPSPWLRRLLPWAMRSSKAEKCAIQ
jgi:hypothetical protein